MTLLSEKAFRAEAARLLTPWLGQPRPEFEDATDDVGADLVVRQGRLRLVVAFKSAGDTAAVSRAVVQVKHTTASRWRSAVPVVAVPFMGEVGRRLCAEAGVSWFDLSGNADIAAPGVRILIEGKPNRFLRRGRPSTAFAPKSSRVARRLLIEPGRSFRQIDLVRETGLGDGFVSRIVRRLVADGLVAQGKDGAVRVADPDRLLDAWGEVYEFDKHTILRGHVTARSGDELLPKLARDLERARVRYAATGLAAAWLHTEFAAFRLVTVFVESHPDEAMLDKAGFRAEPKGANVWLVMPNDEGVFDGSTEKRGVACVHPVQAYVDLQAQPERAKEAATELRTRLLGWKASGK